MNAVELDNIRYSATMNSPLGQLTLVADACSLQSVRWPSTAIEGSSNDLPIASSDHHVINSAIAQLEEYFAGERQVFDLPLDPSGTDFQLEAWLALRAIPFGTTISYGDQAEKLGDRAKARAVGSANARNPISIIVPCHRVVGASGALTGFAGGLDSKAWLLDHERQALGLGPSKLF